MISGQADASKTAQFPSNPERSDSEETVTDPAQQLLTEPMTIGAIREPPPTPSLTMLPPPSPQGPTLRLARLSDLPRISAVAAAGFFHSPIFQYQKPFFDAYPVAAYPLDTIATERSKFREGILDPKRAVVVIEAALDTDEFVRVCRALRREYPALDDDHYPKSPAGKRGIVGVANFCFPDGHLRIGDFTPEDYSTGGLANAHPPKCKKRDACTKGKELYKRSVSAANHKYLTNCIRIAIAVHPAYWHRGHAKMLMQWGFELADREQSLMGVCTGETGKKVFESMGFRRCEEVTVPGYEEHPKSIGVWIGVREPGGLGAGHSGNAVVSGFSGLGGNSGSGGAGHGGGAGCGGGDGQNEGSGHGGGSGRGGGFAQ